MRRSLIVFLSGLTLALGAVGWASVDSSNDDSVRALVHQFHRTRDLLLYLKDADPELFEELGKHGQRLVRRQEAIAMAFVAQNHPELWLLLKEMRKKDRLAYRSAIRDLVPEILHIRQMNGNNTEESSMAVRRWKLASRIRLLSARWIVNNSPETESELRTLLLEQQRQSDEKRAWMIRKQQEQLERLRGKEPANLDEEVEKRLVSIRQKALRQRKQQSDD